MIAWVSRQGPLVVLAVKDFTVTTVQQAADVAVQAGSWLYTDSVDGNQLCDLGQILKTSCFGSV